MGFVYPMPAGCLRRLVGGPQKNTPSWWNAPLLDRPRYSCLVEEDQDGSHRCISTHATLTQPPVQAATG
jgi:hypothetical protein